MSPLMKQSLSATTENGKRDEKKKPVTTTLIVLRITTNQNPSVSFFQGVNSDQ